MAKKLSFTPTLRHVLAIRATAIRLRAFLDWKQNYLREPPLSVSSFLSHKTILE